MICRIASGGPPGGLSEGQGEAPLGTPVVLRTVNWERQSKLDATLALDFRTRGRFSLSVYFGGVKDETELNIQDVSTRFYIQRSDGKNLEIDIKVDSLCGRTVLVEVKKTQTKTNKKAIEDFQEKVEIYRAQNPGKTVLPAFLSLGGFTGEALSYCKEKGISTANRLNYYQEEWSK